MRPMLTAVLSCCVVALTACGTPPVASPGASPTPHDAPPRSDSPSAAEAERQDDALASEQNPQPPKDVLKGGTWVLTEGSLNGRSIHVPDGSRITLTPGQRDHVGGSSACNGYGATVDYEGERVEFTMTSQTEMACAPKVMAAERDYLEALPQVTTATRQGGTLQLSGPDVGLTFDLSKPIVIEDISGIEWELESLVVDGTSSPPGGEPVRLLLHENGTVTGSTGCRQLHGRYDTFGDQINFPDFGAEGDCPPQLQDQDSHIVGALSDGFRAELQGEALRLTSDGNAGLIYRRSG